jgi:tyrosine-protein kinase Etk/Wzc
MASTEQVAMAHSGTPQDDEPDFLDLLQVVADNLRLLVVAPLSIGLVVLAITFAIPPTFTAMTRVMPPQQQSSAAMMLQSLGALGGLAGAAAGIKNPNDQFVAFLGSESIANALIERFGLIERYEADFRTDARRTLNARSKITTGRDGLITIEVDDKDPAFAARLANAYVEEFSHLLNRLALTEAQQRRAFFESQLAQAKDNLVKAETALKASGVSPSALKSNPEAAVKAVAELQARIAAQEIRLASMRGYLTENAPDFVQARNELVALRSQLSLSERSVAPQAAGDTDYIARFRDFKYYETLFELFAKQYELAKIDEAREGSLIQVVDVALVPERKSKPKKAQIAVLTTLACGTVLLLFVSIRQYFRNARLKPTSAEKVSRLHAALRQALGRS